MKHAFVFSLLTAASALADGDWRDKLSPVTPGGFAPPRPLTAHYRMGWSGITAGEASIRYSHPKSDVLQIDATGGTTGFARTLWKLDATHTATAHASSLRPIAMKQTETYRGYTMNTELQFMNAGVTRIRQKIPNDPLPSKKTLKFPHMFDLHTALLFVRSQRLENGRSFSFVVYSITSPSLETVTVTGRENISVKAGKYNAIRLDLKQWDITKKFEIESDRNFKRATAWLSDDADRLPLKIEAEIFVGSVWAELERVKISK